MIYENKNYRVFTIKAFGKSYNVICVPQYYSSNGSLAIRVLEVEGDTVTDPFGVLTSNLENPLQGSVTAFVKNYSENEEWAEKLANKIGKSTGVTCSSGYVQFPLYKFDLDKCYE